jgi:hypothetical protein
MFFIGDLSLRVWESQISSINVAETDDHAGRFRPERGDGNSVSGHRPLASSSQRPAVSNRNSPAAAQFTVVCSGVKSIVHAVRDSTNETTAGNQNSRCGHWLGKPTLSGGSGD